MAIKAEDAAKLRETVTNCAQEVWNEYGIAARLVEGPGPQASEKQLAAFIGFSGRVLRGTLTIVAPFKLVRAAYPLQTDKNAVPEQDVFDWGGELANQLLGRTKNELIAQGLELQASTPQTVFADQLHVTRSQKTSVCVLWFAVGKDSIAVWFDAVAEEGVELWDVPRAENECTAEGEMVLF